jgi:hypothetical protein
MFINFSYKKNINFFMYHQQLYVYCQWFVYHHLKETDVEKFAANIFRGN